MVDLELLNQIVTDTGMTKTFISTKSGIPRASLYSKLDGKSPFTVEDVVGLSKALNLTKKQREQIFLL